MNEPLFVVRFWDGMDGIWYDVTEAVSQQEADAVWNEKTQNGTIKTTFDDIDYYQIFPADTIMKYSGNREMFR